MFGSVTQLQMKTFQASYMENQIISAIRSSSDFRDLLPYVQHIMDLETMKEILISEFHKVSNPPQKPSSPNVEQKSTKTEIPSKQSTSSIERIRSIYLNCSSLEEILPEVPNPLTSKYSPLFKARICANSYPLYPLISIP